MRKQRENTARQRIWRVLKSGRIWQIEDMAMICETSENHCRKFLSLLEKTGYCRRLAGFTYQLIRDTGDLAPVEKVPNQIVHDPNTNEVYHAEH